MPAHQAGCCCQNDCIIFEDDFNRADGSPGSPWGGALGTWAISGTTLAMTDFGSDDEAHLFAFYEWTDEDHDLPSPGSLVRVQVRSDTDGDALGIYHDHDEGFSARVVLTVGDTPKIQLWYGSASLGAPGIYCTDITAPVNTWHELELCVETRNHWDTDEGDSEFPQLHQPVATVKLNGELVLALMLHNSPHDPSSLSHAIPAFSGVVVKVGEGAVQFDQFKVHELSNRNRDPIPEENPFYDETHPTDPQEDLCPPCEEPCAFVHGPGRQLRLIVDIWGRGLDGDPEEAQVCADQEGCDGTLATALNATYDLDEVEIDTDQPPFPEFFTTPWQVCAQFELEITEVTCGDVVLNRITAWVVGTAVLIAWTDSNDPDSWFASFGELHWAISPPDEIQTCGHSYDGNVLNGANPDDFTTPETWGWCWFNATDPGYILFKFI